eukprot:scaffold23532_cov31-Tisochrysis_lutea.AAC.4
MGSVSLGGRCDGLRFVESLGASLLSNTFPAGACDAQRCDNSDDNAMDMYRKTKRSKTEWQLAG